MRKLLVNENDANQRVDKFLSKTLPKLPKNLMYKYIRNKKIKVNGKRCEISQKLASGDEFTCYIAEEFFETQRDDSFFRASTNLNILYEDDNIIVMNKEVGLLAHSDDKISDDTLVNRMKHYLYQKGEYAFESEQSFAPALCHRIDRNTQGIVIGAKTAQALRDMNEAIREGCIDKRYLCIVEGTLQEKEKTVHAFHKKENKEVFIRDSEKEGFKEIITGYQVLKEAKGLSLLAIRLYTGKSHQIRALMAHLKHPLYGDTRYGAKPRKYPYQALCAYRVKCSNMPGSLAYLNDQVWEIKDVDFLKIMQ